MSDDDLDVRWMADISGQLILAAVDGDAGRSADLLADVSRRYGWRGGYSLCCALSEAIAKMGDHELNDDGDFFGFEVISSKTGGAIAPEAAIGAEDVVLATRFVVAHVNRDTTQKLALFRSAMTEEEALRLPVGLLKLVAAYGRHRLAQAGSTDG